MDSLGSTRASSDLTSSIGSSTQSPRDTPEHGCLSKCNYDQILEEEEEEEEGGNEDSVCEIPKEETVRTVCEQAARNISEVLGAELRGGLQEALREEVSRALREEFQRCSQELWELRRQRPVAETGCQADCTTVPAELQPRGLQHDVDLIWPVHSSPQSETSDGPCSPGLLPVPQPRTDADAKANRGQKLKLQEHGAKAHRRQTSCGDSFVPGNSSRAQPATHRHSCGDGFVSGVSGSRQSMVDEEQSVTSAQQKRHLCEVCALLWQQGLVKYAVDVPASKSSSSSSQSHKTRAGPKALGSSRPRSQRSPSPRGRGRACLIGADPSEDVLPPEDDKKEGCSFRLLSASRSSRERKRVRPQDSGLQQERATFTSTDEEGVRSTQTTQDLACSFSDNWRQRPSTPKIQGSFCSEASRDSLKELARQVENFSATERAMEADVGVERSLSQSTSQGRKWSKLGPSQVPAAEMLRLQRDEELASQLSSKQSSGASDIVTPAPSGEEPGRRRPWFVALAADMRNLFGSLVIPACGILPWTPAYPLASSLYQWIIVGLVGAGLYHSASETYQEWELGEASRALVLAQEAAMGTGALAGLLACGALWRSKSLVACNKLLMAYSCRAGLLSHWDEVSAADFSCTASFWFASVLASTLLSLHFEHCATSQELLSHVGWFALFAFLLLGMSQFAIHKCRCLTKTIDMFCLKVIETLDFSAALTEWSLFMAVCRDTCSTIQLLFLSLQATAMAIVLLSIQQVGRHDSSRLVTLAPGLLVALGVFRTSLRAAAVTDKCVRVPMLVNSVSVGNLLDHERMYAVHYIVYSQAGFYVCDVRLTSSAVVKTAYIVCAVTFFLASRVFVE